MTPTAPMYPENDEYILISNKRKHSVDAIIDISYMEFKKYIQTYQQLEYSRIINYIFENSLEKYIDKIIETKNINEFKKFVDIYLSFDYDIIITDIQINELFILSSKYINSVDNTEIFTPYNLLWFLETFPLWMQKISKTNYADSLILCVNNDNKELLENLINTNETYKNFLVNKNYSLLFHIFINEAKRNGDCNEYIYKIKNNNYQILGNYFVKNFNFNKKDIDYIYTEISCYIIPKELELINNTNQIKTKTKKRTFWDFLFNIFTPSPSPSSPYKSLLYYNSNDTYNLYGIGSDFFYSGGVGGGGHCGGDSGGHCGGDSGGHCGGDGGG